MNLARFSLILSIVFLTFALPVEILGFYDFDRERRMNNFKSARNNLARSVFIFLALVSASCVAVAAEEDGEWGASVGYDYSSGKYGGVHNTTTRSLPVSLSYAKGDYSFDLTIPYVWQDGPTGRVLRFPLRLEIGNVSGIGDVSTSVTRYFFGDDENAANLALKALVNFGTADASKGLGTGKNDYSIQGDVSKLFGPATLSATLGYTVVGKLDGLDMRNIYYGALDAAFDVSDKLTAGLTLNFGMSPFAGAPNPRDLTVYFSYPVSKNARLSVYLLKGFSDGSPDNGNGASLAFYF